MELRNTELPPSSEQQFLNIIQQGPSAQSLTGFVFPELAQVKLLRLQ